MTDEITISEFMDEVYDLSSIGMDATFFIIEEDGKYVESKNNYFEIISLHDFIWIGDNYVLINEDKDELAFTEEQFFAIKDLI